MSHEDVECLTAIQLPPEAHSLDQSDHLTRLTRRKARRGSFIWRHPLIQLAICAATVILLFACIQSPTSESFRSIDAFSPLSTLHDSKVTTKPPLIPYNTGLLHLLIPASKPDVNLCKSILSSTILGYPIPVLLNWGGSSNNIAKIPGTLRYLKTLGPHNDQDLVIVADGYDIWYQLPPHILINRYHEINRRANVRIHARLGSKTMKTQGINQRIVISSQKNCWPGDDKHVNCYSVPESPLPRYIYGPQTDTNVKNNQGELSSQQKMRQRWLNGGFIMGPVEDMRRLFERANERAMADEDQEGWDQGVLTGIFADQEYQREKLRTREKGPWKRFHRPPPAREVFEAEEGVQYEFGIGLDYSSELSQATKYSEHDLDWVTFSIRSTIDIAITKHNVTSPHITSLQPDIANAPLPFNSLALLSNTNVSNITSTPWTSVPLWTNLYTGITPALVHHNAHFGHLKTLRQTQWHKMWFVPHARDLLRARLKMNGGGEQLVAVNRKRNKWFGLAGEEGFGVRTDKSGEEWMGWGEICGGEEEGEIWRDGEGKWVD
ncbi:hypothetical protein ACLMJK_002973 [Lecanora helva]